jgi:hypothetical protein
MSNTIHAFKVEHAELWGIECAIMIAHLIYWVEYNQRLKRNFIENRTWTFQTQIEIAAHFPYWSVDQIYRIIKKLTKLEVIIKGNFNKSPYDRTIWYAFKNEFMFINPTKINNTIPQNRGMNSEDVRNEFHEIVEPIPNNIPVIDKDTTTPDLEVVVFSDLKISESLKKILVKKYTYTEIVKAVIRAKAWEKRSNDEAALVTCLGRQNEWNDESLETPEDNRIWALSLPNYQPDKVKFEVFNKCVEFTVLRCTKEPIGIEYTEKGFKNKVTALLKAYKFIE